MTTTTTEVNFLTERTTDRTPKEICQDIVNISEQVSELEAQIKKLQEIKKGLETEAEEMKETLRPFVGQNIGAFKIWTKTGESLIMDKNAVIPEQFQRIKIEADKIAMKKAIVSGKEFSGFWIEKKEHIQIDLIALV